MKKCECLLCGHPAERNVLKGPSETSKFAIGYKYKCPDCGLYAFDHDAYHWLEAFGTKEHKEKLSEHIKNNPDERGEHKVLKRPEVEKILNVTIPAFKLS